MSNRNFDASQITKRLGNKAVAKSIINNFSSPNTNPQTSNANVSVINQVELGNSLFVTRGPTCTVLDNGCPCNISTTTSESNIPLGSPWLDILIKSQANSTLESFDIEVSNNYIVYTGIFAGTIDLYNSSVGDSTEYVMSLTSLGSYDSFLAVYNNFGILQWATKISSVDFELAVQISITNSGIYLISSSTTSPSNIYNGGLTDPITPVISLTSSGAAMAMLIKYSFTGQVLWATKFTGFAANFSYSIITDGNNIYWASQYSTNSMLPLNNVYNGSLSDPTIPVFQILSTGGRWHCLMKYDSNGQLQWVAKLGNNNPFPFDGTPYVLFSNLAISNTQILMSGSYYDTCEIYNGAYGDPSVLAINMISSPPGTGEQNIYLVSFDLNTGSVNWATKTSGSGPNTNRSLICDSNGDIYLYASFENNINLYDANGLIDPTVAAVTLSPITPTANMLIKYNNTGNILWSTKISGSISVSSGDYLRIVNSEIYIVDSMATTINFYNSNSSITDPTIIGQSYAVTGLFDIILYKYNINTGNFILLNKINSNFSLLASGISIYNNIVYVSGKIIGLVEFYDMNVNIPNLVPSLIITLPTETNLIVKYNTNGNLLTN
jgi:hypothetical protein